jgi:glycine oxidase
MDSMSQPADVVVIGAGVVGCCIAYELARRGTAVRVVDGRTIGMGATQASAGILAPYLETHEGSPLLPLAVRSLGLFDEFIQRVTSDGAVSVSYHRNGTLDVATDEEHFKSLQTTAEALDRRGVSATLLGGDAARAEEPHLAADVLGGLLISAHGFVAASELTRAAAAAACHHGAKLVERSHATRVARKHGNIIVETESGSLNAGAVVLAAGSWSGTLDIEGVRARVPVRPVRGQLLHLIWPGARLRHVIWSPKCYLVPWDDGTVLVGATMEEAGFDERATVAGVRDLLEAACDIAPQAWTAGFVGARVGLRPGTSDDLPVIGPSRVVPNLFYATGHFRNGVLLAPLTAQLVADALLDDKLDSDLAAVNPSRFGDL